MSNQSASRGPATLPSSARVLTAHTRSASLKTRWEGKLHALLDGQHEPDASVRLPCRLLLMPVFRQTRTTTILTHTTSLSSCRQSTLSQRLQNTRWRILRANQRVRRQKREVRLRMAVSRRMQRERRRATLRRDWRAHLSYQTSLTAASGPGGASCLSPHRLRLRAGPPALLVTRAGVFTDSN